MFKNTIFTKNGDKLTVEEAKKTAKEMLSDERFYHTQCVAKTARALAAQYGEDQDRAEIAGYLHDIAKEMPGEALLQMIERSAIIDVDELRYCQPIWHARAGGVYVRETLHCDDGIADAVSNHTTGRAGMARLEKIVFLADYISEDRNFRDLDNVRELAFASLDEAVIEVIARQIRHLMKHKKYVDLDTVRAYNDLTVKRAE